MPLTIRNNLQHCSAVLLSCPADEIQCLRLITIVTKSYANNKQKVACIVQYI